MRGPGEDPPYLMGRSEGEKRRLIRQAQLYNPLTRRPPWCITWRPRDRA